MTPNEMNHTIPTDTQIDCEACGEWLELNELNARHDCGCKFICNKCIKQHDEECDEYKNQEARDDEYYKDLEAFRKSNGIKNSVWCYEEGDDKNFPISKFAEKHPFSKIKWIVVGYWGTTRTKIMGDTWLDIWKACDKAIKKAKSQHHPFIEILEVKGNMLDIHCGS